MITPCLNISSLLLGLAAWGLGLNAIRREKISLSSFSCCGLAMLFQFYELRHRAQIGDVYAIVDTIGGICLAATVLLAGTVFLNLRALARGKK